MGIKYEKIGKKYIRSLGYNELQRSEIFPFDLLSNRYIFEIKTKRIPCSRKYTFDFTKSQLNFYKKTKKKIKVLVILLKENGMYEFKMFDIEDFQNINRETKYKIFNALNRVRLTLKKEKRIY